MTGSYLFRHRAGAYRPAFGGRYLIPHVPGNSIGISYGALLAGGCLFSMRVCPTLVSIGSSATMVALYGALVGALGIASAVFLTLTWLTEPGVLINLARISPVKRAENQSKPGALRKKCLSRFMQGFWRGSLGRYPSRGAYASVNTSDASGKDSMDNDRTPIMPQAFKEMQENTEIKINGNNSDTTLTDPRSKPPTRHDERVILSAADGDFHTVCTLLQMGALPNFKNKQLRSPLHIASYKGFASICNVLLEHGADCSSRDSFGLTPLHYSIVNGHDSCSEVLLRHGASLCGSCNLDGDCTSSNVQVNLSNCNLTDHLNALREIAIQDTNTALNTAASAYEASSEEDTLVKRGNLLPQRCSEKTWEQPSNNIDIRSGSNVEGESKTNHGTRESASSWCHVCQHYRPPLSYHCELCGICIESYVEYCRLVANAVGKRNYGFYVGLLVSSSFFTLGCMIPSMYIMICDVIGLMPQVTHLWETILAILSLIFSVPLCSLTLYHLAALTLEVPTCKSGLLVQNNGAILEEQKARVRIADGQGIQEHAHSAPFREGVCCCRLRACLCLAMDTLCKVGAMIWAPIPTSNAATGGINVCRS